MCFVSQATHLELRRNAGAELDQLVVEERHAHLERVRHRGAVEVVEHVVDQPELCIDVERRWQRVVRQGRQGAGAKRGAPPGRRVSASGPRRRLPRRSVSMRFPVAIDRKRSTVLSAASVGIARRIRLGATGASRSRALSRGAGRRRQAAAAAAAWCLE